jgi:putative integral membrane protein (TIGR02587 family)
VPATAARSSPDALLIGIGRAAGGALVFSLPMLMTQEMWALGLSMDRWRLLLLIIVSVPLLMFLSHYSGFERTWGWKEDLRDVAIALGIGIVVSTAVLVLLAVIGPGRPAGEIVGKVALQAVPAALGALLGRSQLGHDAEREVDESYGGELVVMAVGALFLALNVAPTEEILVLSLTMSPWHLLVLVGVSLLCMHGFVFATGFKGGTELTPETPWWSAFCRFTLVGYVVGLLVSVYVLWTFVQLDGLGFAGAISAIVVLGFPAAIGAAAARLIL